MTLSRLPPNHLVLDQDYWELTKNQVVYSGVNTQLAAQDSKDLRFFARTISLGIAGFSLLTTCGILLAMQLDHHQEMRVRRAEIERLIVLDSKCLGGDNVRN